MRLQTNNFRFFAILLGIFLALSSTPNKSFAQNVNFQVFYDELSPYGQWLQDPTYGYVWQPAVSRDFRPYYSNGHWAWTEYGNMWVSEYPWGWAAFHYGRWFFHDRYGWLWLPGNEWAPAWVSWRQGAGHYGWAPLGPGISINISFSRGYHVPDYYWTFIPYAQIYNKAFHRYYSPRRTTVVVNKTVIINNTYVDKSSRNTYVTGPRRAEVERMTGRGVTEYQVGTRARPGIASARDGRIEVYRPNVRETRSVATPRSVREIQKPIEANESKVRTTTSPVNRSASTATPASRSATPASRSATPASRTSTAAPAARKSTPAVRQTAPAASTTTANPNRSSNLKPRAVQPNAQAKPQTVRQPSQNAAQRTRPQQSGRVINQNSGSRNIQPRRVESPQRSSQVTAPSRVNTPDRKAASRKAASPSKSERFNAR